MKKRWWVVTHEVYDCVDGALYYDPTIWMTKCGAQDYIQRCKKSDDFVPKLEKYHVQQVEVEVSGEKLQD